MANGYPSLKTKRKQNYAERGKRVAEFSHKAKKKTMCGARLQDGRTCTRTAGWGTSHFGTGNCKTHAGNVPNHRKKAIREEAINFMGAPMDINPFDAIMWCIKITAGEVQWLSMQIAEIDEDDWIEDTALGKQMHVMQRTRALAQDRLVRYSKEAISLGLAERSIRLAENFGLVLARLLENIKNDLGLSREQEKRWPHIVRRQLIIMQGGTPPDDGEVINGYAEDANALTA
jgi:hypothetical protein